MREQAASLQFVRYWLPVLAWMTVISAGTSMPVPLVMELEGGDLVVHALIYAVLGGLLFRAFRGDVGLGIGWSALAAVLWGGLYGAYDEVHQAFLASRSCSLVDWGADLLGVGAATVVGVLVSRRARACQGEDEHITTHSIGDDPNVG